MADLELIVASLLGKQGSKFLVLEDDETISKKSVLKLICGVGHTTFPQVSNILRGDSCRKCKDQSSEALAAKKKVAQHLQIMQRRQRICMRKASSVAKRGDFTCSFVRADKNGRNAIYQFSCLAGHSFQQPLVGRIVNILCPYCLPVKRPSKAGQKFLNRITKVVKIHREAQKFALKLDAKLLSEEYVDLSTPLRWRCKNNHDFSNTWRLVRKGQWCTECRKDERAAKYLSRLRSIAYRRGGILLSDTYLGILEKHHFACARGHDWWATAGNVVHGSWCRECCLGRAGPQVPAIEVLTANHKMRAEALGNSLNP